MMKKVNSARTIMLAAAGALAAGTSAETMELLNQTIETNEVVVVLSAAGDHVTVVDSHATATNGAFDVHDSTGVRRSPLYVVVTNSTIESLKSYVSFEAKSYTGNTVDVDVVSSTITATNASNGLLSLGVVTPKADWGERVRLNAVDSEFNLCGLRGYGALDAVFSNCRLTFGDSVASGSGFGPVTASCKDPPLVTFRDCFVTNWTPVVGRYESGASPRIVFDGGTAYLRGITTYSNLNGYKLSGDFVLTNGASVCLVRSPAEQGESNTVLEFGKGTTNRLDITGGSSLSLQWYPASAKRPDVFAGMNDGGYAEWNIVNGTFDDSLAGKKIIFYWGCRAGSAALNIGDGGLFKCWRFVMGQYENGADLAPSAVNQTGGKFYTCAGSEDEQYSYISLCENNGHDCRYILDGGELKTVQIYGGAGAAANGGTGRAVLSANGGRLTPGYNSTKYELVSKLDRAECGPKGLTVDTGGYSAGAVIAQEFTNKEGERGLFRKAGAYTLTLALPGRSDWDVAETRVEGGTLTLTNGTAVLKTALVVTNGATFSMVGSAASLTLDALAVPGGTLALDPGDTITVPASGLSLGGLAITFSSELECDSEADVFLCEGEVSEANLRKIRDAITASEAVPAGHYAKVETSVEGGVTHVRLKVAEQSARLTDSTTWQGAEDAWQTAGSWTAGVPTQSAWAEFPQSAALKSITVPHAAPVGAVRFTGDGYELSGGALAVSGERGEAVIVNEAGSNTIGASMTFADIVEITNAPNTTLTLAGPITGGGFEKTGDGRLELGASNELGDIVALSGGRTVVSDAAAFGTDEGFTTRVTLGAGTLEFGEALGDGASVDGAFLINTPVNTRGVAMWAATNVTVAAPSSKNGAFVKAGPGRLTMLVSGDTTLVAGKVHAKDTFYARKYFVIGEDGALPDNADYAAVTEGYFAGASVYEGELVLKAAEGSGTPKVVVNAADTYLGLHTDGATNTPSMTIDGVAYSTVGFYANGFNMANRDRDGGLGKYDLVPSLLHSRLAVVNGGSITCSKDFFVANYCVNEEMKPSTVMTNGTITTAGTFYFVHCNVAYTSITDGSLASFNAVDSTLASDTYIVDGHLAAELSGSVLGPRTADGYAEFTGDKGAFGKLLLKDGSVFRVGTLDFSSKFNAASPTRVFALAFDDAEWQYGAGDYTLGSSVVDENHATNFVIRMEGKGVVLKPASGTTFTTELPFQGEGGMVVDGPGTVAFAADTVKFSGVAEVKQGTLDLSAAGALDGFTVKGPGVVHGAALVNPTISLDVDDGWGVSGVPVFDGCAISGRVRVDCGRTDENPLEAPSNTPVVVARFTGAAPDVSGWRLLGSGAPRAHGVFSVQGDTVVMTVSKPGFTLVVR